MATRSCGPTAGAARRTPPGTCCPPSGRASTCSTSAAGRARSPSTWPPVWRPAGWGVGTPEDRQWWARSWADRLTASTFTEQALEHGFATRAELEEIAAAYLRWAADDDGWLGMLHGELLIRV